MLFAKLNVSLESHCWLSLARDVQCSIIVPGIYFLIERTIDEYPVDGYPILCPFGCPAMLQHRAFQCATELLWPPAVCLLLVCTV